MESVNRYAHIVDESLDNGPMKKYPKAGLKMAVSCLECVHGVTLIGCRAHCRFYGSKDHNKVKERFNDRRRNS